MTPLLLAITQERKEFVHLLLEAGASQKHSYFDYLSPLSRAAKEGYKEICELLIRKGADVNYQTEHVAHTTETSLWTPLHFALNKGDAEICKLLIQAGADLELMDHLGRTPLAHAASLALGRKGIARMLIKSGALVDTCDLTDSTPLHLACRNGGTPMVDLLLESGASANAMNMTASTPLHYAAKGGSLVICKKLLEAGADPLARNDQGETPMDFIPKDREDFISLFEAYALKRVATAMHDNDQGNTEDTLSRFGL